MEFRSPLRRSVIIGAVAAILAACGSSPSTRAENARTQEGMALRLSIAQQIAGQHGGAIAVESEPGHGSRFTVTLPLFARQAVEASL